MVPIIALLLLSFSLRLIPGLASSQGESVAACHLVEVLSSHLLLVPGRAQLPAADVPAKDLRAGFSIRCLK